MIHDEKIKAVIFDADGVLIHQVTYFSERLSLEYGVSKQKVLEFFEGEFLECLVGKKDLKEILPVYMKEWGWDRSVEELLVYWFETERDLDQDLIDYICLLKDKGVMVIVGTNNEKHRTEYMRRNLGFGKIFHAVYGSGDIGYAKPNHKFFEHILKENNLEKSEVLFWDDREANVEAGRVFGITAELYTNFSEFEDIMRKYI